MRGMTDEPRATEAPVTVTVRLAARLGPSRRSVRLASGSTVADLVAVLAPELGHAPNGLASRWR